MSRRVSIPAAFIAIILLTGGCGTLASLAEKAGIRSKDSGTEEIIDWGTPSEKKNEITERTETVIRDDGDSGKKIGTDKTDRPEIITGEPEGLKHPEALSFPEHTFLTETQKNLLATAKGKLGCRYSSAGTGPNTFDCSGFMLYVFAKEGINLPHGSAAQYSCGRSLKIDEPLKEGDLVFFSERRISSNVGHVGMVVDYDRNTHEFTFIHAAMTGVEIQKSTAEYYALRYIGARRILADD